MFQKLIGNCSIIFLNMISVLIGPLKLIVSVATIFYTNHFASDDIIYKTTCGIQFTTILHVFQKQIFSVIFIMLSQKVATSVSNKFLKHPFHL